MKTQAQVQKEIDETLAKPVSMIHEPRKHGKLVKRLELLTKVRAYLQSGPTNVFVVKERARIEHRLQAIGDQYGWWVTDQQFGSVKARRDAYDRLFCVPDLRAQLATLVYLLEETQPDREVNALDAPGKGAAGKREK